MTRAPTHYLIGFYFKICGEYLQWYSRCIGLQTLATPEAAMSAKHEKIDAAGSGHPVARRISSKGKKGADAGRRMVEQALGAKRAARKGAA